MTFSKLSIRAVMLMVVALSPKFLSAADRTTEHTIVGLFCPECEKDLNHILETVPEIHLVHLDYNTARVTLKYDVTALFPERNPKNPPKDLEVETRLNQLLQNASENVFTLVPSSKSPPAKITQLEMKIGLLDCRGCRYGAYLAMMKIDGVERATVVDHLITASIDPTKTNQATIDAALKKIGVEFIEKK